MSSPLRAWGDWSIASTMEHLRRGNRSDFGMVIPKVQPFIDTFDVNYNHGSADLLYNLSNPRKHMTMKCQPIRHLDTFIRGRNHNFLNKTSRRTNDRPSGRSPMEQRGYCSLCKLRLSSRSGIQRQRQASSTCQYMDVRWTLNAAD